MKSCKIVLFSLLALLMLGGAYFAYMAWAFPTDRCEAAKASFCSTDGGRLL